MPRMARENQLYGFIREEKRVKGGFGSKKKVVTIKDFRGNEFYDDDVDDLKGLVENYISLHADLGEEAKNNLRELKVTEGSTKEEVKLLLGRPDKISTIGSNAYGASELWIYKINEIDTFAIFIIPIFFPHQGYYLYFKDNILAAIERHYLEQTIHQGSAPGVGVGGVESKK